VGEKYEKKQKQQPQEESQPLSESQQQGAEAAPIPGTASSYPKSKIGNYSIRYFEDTVEKIFSGDIDSIKTKSPEFQQMLLHYAIFRLNDKITKLARELGG
jgi:hypothetical protein